jgi:hypothetical protein
MQQQHIQEAEPFQGMTNGAKGYGVVHNAGVALAGSKDGIHISSPGYCVAERILLHDADRLPTSLQALRLCTSERPRVGCTWLEHLERQDATGCSTERT